MIQHLHTTPDALHFLIPITYLTHLSTFLPFDNNQFVLYRLESGS